MKLDVSKCASKRGARTAPAPATGIADAVLALLRRVSFLEASRADRSQLRTVESGLRHARAKLKTAEEALGARIDAQADYANREFVSVKERADELAEVAYDDRDKLLETSDELFKVGAAVRRLTDDTTAAARDALAPERAALAALDAEVRLATIAHRDRIAQLEDTRAHVSLLDVKADVTDVEKRAHMDQVDTVAGHVATLAVTLGSMEERLFKSETLSKKATAVNSKADQLFKELREVKMNVARLKLPEREPTRDMYGQEQTSKAEAVRGPRGTPLGRSGSLVSTERPRGGAPRRRRRPVLGISARHPAAAPRPVLGMSARYLAPRPILDERPSNVDKISLRCSGTRPRCAHRRHSEVWLPPR